VSTPFSPRLLKCGIVQVEPGTGQVLRTISLQYNPDTLTRSLQVQAASAGGGQNQSEALRLKEPGVRLKTGIRRTLAAHAMAAGAWENTADGARIWRMAFHSPDSRGMRVEFDNFSVGAGKVWLHDGVNVAGPYTGRGTLLYPSGYPTCQISLPLRGS
jgi:hypothetical protein